MLSVAKRKKMMLNHNLRNAITRGIDKCHASGYSKPGDIETFVIVEMERMIRCTNKDPVGIVDIMNDNYIVSISQLTSAR